MKKQITQNSVLQGQHFINRVIAGLTRNQLTVKLPMYGKVPQGGM